MSTASYIDVNDLKDLLKYPFESNFILQKRKSIKKRLLDENNNFITKKIAILGGSTTYDIVNILELFLLSYGIKPQFYESDYNQYYEDIMFNNENLLKFNPDIIYIHTNNRNISSFPSMKDTAGTISTMLDSEFQKYTNIWKKIEEDYNCITIQNNFEMPFYRLMGNKDAYDIHGRINFLSKLNMRMYEYAQGHRNFYINDINYLAATFGIEKWADNSAWYLYKYFCSIEAIPELAFNIANIVKSIYGKNKKAFVLDLDNTLWGGVIADDGLEGIKIGNETPTGQAYCEFQEYIKKHKDLGIILNINSKNSQDSAICGLSHPENILKSDDFICIKANWQNKDSNIYEICSELNILPESLVFVDDNPAERNFVNSQINGISVPEIDKIENYIRIIDRSGFFETTSISNDDVDRNKMYKDNIGRVKQQQYFKNYKDYLKSLKMIATIKDFDNLHIQRIVQLTNKSNQFNLTTKRYTQNEIENISSSNSYICIYGKLTDKFGDNGIVSVVIGKKDVRILHIELWLMSCRTIKRDMEFAMLDRIVEKSKLNNISTIIGYYYKTSKNDMVKNLYADFNFKLIKEDTDGNSIWELNLKNYKNKNSIIKVVK